MIAIFSYIRAFCLCQSNSVTSHTFMINKSDVNFINRYQLAQTLLNITRARIMLNPSHFQYYEKLDASLKYSFTNRIILQKLHFWRYMRMLTSATYKSNMHAINHIACFYHKNRNDSVFRYRKLIAFDSTIWEQK